MAAELHVHLEGSVLPETVQLLEPEISKEEIRAAYRFTDFAGFLECFKWIVQKLRTPEDYALITRAMLNRLDREGIRYVEITLSAGVILWKKLEFAPIYDAIRRESLISPVQVLWNLDAIRQFGPDAAMRVAEVAAQRVNDGVISFGIGGDEVTGPARWFGEVYAFAKKNGLRLTAHAGETAGPESVWAALEIGAERIGHGIRAIDDPVLLKHLREHSIPLEVCITSNVCTGAVVSLESHPVRRLYEAGVPLTLNTDDPAIFGTTLAREFAIARDRFGFDEAQMEQLRNNAWKYAFATQLERGD